MTRTITQPVKYPGGKHNLAKRIISLMPRHVHFVETHVGGGAVFWARDPDDPRLWLPPHKGVSEVVNDIDARLMNFWEVLKDEELFREFVRKVQAIPMARAAWNRAHAWVKGGAVDDAVALFVDIRQSRAGETKSFTPITRRRTRRRRNDNVAGWLGAVDGLADVHARLRCVLLENIDAIDLIVREDTPGTLFYCDPPYVHASRSNNDRYKHEMTDADHVRLAEVLNRVQGKVILSGYPSALYDRLFGSWRRVQFDLPNHAAGGPIKARTIETLWLNYPPEDQAMSS